MQAEPLRDLFLRFRSQRCLSVIDELLYPLGVCLRMSVARNGVGSARRFNQDFGPNQPGLDVH